MIATTGTSWIHPLCAACRAAMAGSGAVPFCSRSSGAEPCCACGRLGLRLTLVRLHPFTRGLVCGESHPRHRGAQDWPIPVLPRLSGDVRPRLRRRRTPQLELPLPLELLLTGDR